MGKINVFPDTLTCMENDGEPTLIDFDFDEGPVSGTIFVPRALAVEFQQQLNELLPDAVNENTRAAYHEGQRVAAAERAVDDGTISETQDKMDAAENADPLCKVCQSRVTCTQQRPSRTGVEVGSCYQKRQHAYQQTVTGNSIDGVPIAEAEDSAREVDGAALKLAVNEMTLRDRQLTGAVNDLSGAASKMLNAGLDMLDKAMGGSDDGS